MRYPKCIYANLVLCDRSCMKMRCFQFPMRHYENKIIQTLYNDPDVPIILQSYAIMSIQVQCKLTFQTAFSR